jgi:hypothetical protein
LPATSKNLSPDSERNDGWTPPLGKRFETHFTINAKSLQQKRDAEANDNLAAAMESR